MSNTIRLTKEFRFETAHALYNYDGLCKNIHGHSYILQVTVIGSPLDDRDNPKWGMVMDFGELKAIVNREIVDPLDHSVVLNSRLDDAAVKKLREMSEKVWIVDYQPTCENMLIDFAKRLTASLPSHVKLFRLKLHETANSFAEWYASDNL